MAEKLESWEHVAFTPCYTTYMISRHQSLSILHNQWIEAVDNMDAMDLEFRIQAWHNLMAIAKCFRERLEWDDKMRCPKPLIIEVKGKPMWVTNGIKPGTPEWMEHWQKYPKEQPSMIRRALRDKKKEAKNDGI